LEEGPKRSWFILAGQVSSKSNVIYLAFSKYEFLILFMTKNYILPRWNRAKLLNTAADGDLLCNFVDIGVKEYVKNVNAISIPSSLLVKLPCQVFTLKLKTTCSEAKKLLFY
jgi:Tudor domain